MCNKLGIKDGEGKALVEDKILGPRTRSCIAKLPTLKSGSSGLAVRFVQEVVNAVPVDGDFGPITRNCVMEYLNIHSHQYSSTELINTRKLTARYVTFNADLYITAVDGSHIFEYAIDFLLKKVLNQKILKSRL